MYSWPTAQVIPDTRRRRGGVSGVQIVRKAEGRVQPANRVALLAIDSELCRMAAHWLAGQFPGLAVIVEKRTPRRSLFRRRVERLGLVRVLGQLAFLSFTPLVRWGSRQRIQEIHREFALESRWPEVDIIRVPSVNSPECLSHLRELDPKVVLVIGTRIISRAVLSALPVPFLNYHDGITPKYRGIRGGYWAQVRERHREFGGHRSFTRCRDRHRPRDLPSADQAHQARQLRHLLGPPARDGAPSHRKGSARLDSRNPGASKHRLALPPLNSSHALELHGCRLAIRRVVNEKPVDAAKPDALKDYRPQTPGLSGSRTSCMGGSGSRIPLSAVPVKPDLGGSLLRYAAAAMNRPQSTPMIRK